MKILVIEDEAKTVQLIKQGLEEQLWEVDVAYDGLIGLQLAVRNNYTLIISDIILPGISGLELCRQLRAKGVISPIILLTALSTTDDKIIGLDAGADDYLAKPFEFRELMARIRALTRRNIGSIQTANLLKIADLEMDLDAKTVTRDGKEITLTAKEFLLLEYFIRHQGRVISKVELAEKIWDITFDTGTNVIEVYINFLRKKIDKDFDLTKKFNFFQHPCLEGKSWAFYPDLANEYGLKGNYFWRFDDITIRDLRSYITFAYDNYKNKQINPGELKPVKIIDNLDYTLNYFLKKL
jgi:DNA-binding response OmpR family regulator